MTEPAERTFRVLRYRTRLDTPITAAGGPRSAALRPHSTSCRAGDSYFFRFGLAFFFLPEGFLLADFLFAAFALTGFFFFLAAGFFLAAARLGAAAGLGIGGDAGAGAGGMGGSSTAGTSMPEEGTGSEEVTSIMLVSRSSKR